MSDHKQATIKVEIKILHKDRAHAAELMGILLKQIGDQLVDTEVKVTFL